MPLAPLDPDRFLRWAWARDKGTLPFTVADWAFEFGIDEATARRWVVSLAARVRRGQRIRRANGA